MQADWTTCTAAGGLPTPPACGDRRLQAATGLGDDDSGGGAHSPSAEESRGTSRDAGVSSESESQSRRNLETILAAIRHLEGPAEPLMSLDPDDDDDDDDDGGDVVGQAASNSLTDAAAATVRMMSSVQTSSRTAVITLG